MNIETVAQPSQELLKHSFNLAEASFEIFRQKTAKCFHLSLDQFVKADSLKQIIPLAFPPNQSAPENPRESATAIVDLDGVIVKGALPPIGAIRALREIAERVDSLYILTSRFSPDQDRWFWKNIGKHWKTNGAVSFFPFFTKQEAKNFEESFFPEKTKVLCGFKGLSRSTHETITENISGQPKIVYIGSSFMDYYPFVKILEHHRVNNLPTDKIVFGYVGNHFAF